MAEMVVPGAPVHVPVTWEPSSRQVWLGDIRPKVIGIVSIRSTYSKYVEFSNAYFTLVYVTNSNDLCILEIYMTNICKTFEYVKQFFPTYSA